MHKGNNGTNTGKLSNTNNKINNIASEITQTVIIKSLILILFHLLLSNLDFTLDKISTDSSANTS